MLTYISFNRKIFVTTLPSAASVGGPAYVHEVTSVEGLAFDWVSKKLYWADLFRNRIYSSFSNLTNRVVIAVVQSPRALAIHPCLGYIGLGILWFLWRRSG